MGGLVAPVLGAVGAGLGFLGSKKAAGASATAQRDSAAVQERIANRNLDFQVDQIDWLRGQTSAYRRGGLEGQSGLRGLTDNLSYGGYVPGASDYGDPNIGFNTFNPNVGYNQVNPYASFQQTNPNAQFNQTNAFANYQSVNPNAQYNRVNPNVDLYQPWNFDITQDPSYNFRLSEGLKGVSNSAAASGMSLSGKNMKALNNYAQQAASQEYQAGWGRHRAMGLDRAQVDAQNRDRAIGQEQFATNVQGQNIGRAMQQNQFISGLQDQGLGRLFEQEKFRTGTQEGNIERGIDQQKFVSGLQDAGIGRDISQQQFWSGLQGQNFDRATGQELNRYNTSAQNWQRNASLVDQLFNRNYSMYTDQFGRSAGLYGSLVDMGMGGIAQGAGGQYAGNISNTLGQLGTNLGNTYTNLGASQAAGHQALGNAITSGANLGLSTYGMMNLFGGGNQQAGMADFMRSQMAGTGQ